MDFIQFDSQIQKIADLISIGNFKPDALIGIARGGWIPTRLLSKYLGIKKIYSYGMSYTDETRTTMSFYQDADLSADISKVLVVEDFLESGKSIHHVISTLTTDGKDVKSCAIGYLAKAVLVPTYSLGLITEIPKLPWD